MTSWLSFLLLAVVLSAQTTPPGFATHYVDVGSDSFAARTVVASPVDGSIFVIASNRVIKTDANGNTIAVFNFAAPAAAVSPQGDLLLVGTADLKSLPANTQVIGNPTEGGVFVLRIDANLEGIVSAALIGGDADHSGLGPVRQRARGGSSRRNRKCIHYRVDR